ncbi:hypothetical protein [Streptomyces sp. bgisy034]|uniref:hypothetical protein n=1 Tax=Streptomyces sp. bgisy034 TaxID=3413774 RepID=UPI003EB80203
MWAVEAHLETCRACRGRLSAAVGAGAPVVASLVDTVWSDLEDQLAVAATMPRRRPWSARLSRWMTPTMVPWLVTSSRNSSFRTSPASSLFSPSGVTSADRESNRPPTGAGWPFVASTTAGSSERCRARPG